ncbi:MAG: STAS domain-containing protein [Chlorobiaceae bacterium]
MNYTVSSRKELTILKIEEDVFDFRHGASFKEAIDGMVDKEKTKNLILDFSQVKAIDSCGISSMLLAHQLANQSHGLALFVSLCQQIKELLKLTNLDKQLYIFSSINEVMTLIEPAMKSKRGSKGKSATPAYEVIGEHFDEIDLIAESDLHDEDLHETLAEGDELDIKPDLSTPEEGKSSLSKKRGRPKKNADGLPSDQDSLE